MSNGDGSGIKVGHLTLGAIIVLVAQAIGFGVWIGNLQRTVQEHSDWIASRNAKDFDVRLSVLEHQQANDEHETNAVRDRMEAHIAEDLAKWGGTILPTRKPNLTTP